MKKFITLTIGALVAFTVAATSISTTANAGKRERRLATGLIIGAIGGAIVAGEIHRNKKKRRARQHQRYYGSAHVSRPRYNSNRRYNQRHYDRPRIQDDRYYDQPRVSYERPRYQRRRYQAPRLNRYQRHVKRCYASYRTYDERSDTFIGYDGRERQCRK